MVRRTPGGLGAGGLLGQVILSAILIVACLVVRAVTHAPGVLVVAIAVLIATTASMARATTILLRDGEATAEARAAATEAEAEAAEATIPRRLAVTRGRMTVGGVAAVAAGAMALAIVLPHGDARATATTPATPATAARAVRDFLADAVIDDNAYEACGYLTPAAQRHVTALAGAGQACRTAHAATRPAFAGVRSVGALNSLPLRVTMRGGTAFVRATPPSGRPATFVLRRAAATASDAYRAPACAWRIAAGETAVLPGTASAGAGAG